MKSVRRLFPLLFALAFFACNKTASNDDTDVANLPTPTATSETTDTDSQSDPAASGTLAIDLGTVTADVRQAAMSTMETGDATVMAGGGQIALELTEASSHCTQTGEPISADSSKNVTYQGEDTPRLNTTLPEYVTGRFYCLLAIDTDSMESVPGAITRGRIWPCMIGMVEYDGIEHVKTVATLGADKELTRACIGEFRYQGLETQGIDAINITYTARAVTEEKWKGSWDGYLQYSVEAQGEPFGEGKILVRDSGGILAYGSYDAPDSASNDDGESYVISLNKSTGKVFYEAFMPKYSTRDAASASQGQHKRLLVEGSFDESTKKFTSVTRFEGVESGIFYDPASSFTAKILTLKGTVGSNASDGLRAAKYDTTCLPEQGLTCLRDLGKWEIMTGISQKCWGQTGSQCTNNDGILLASEKDLEFLLDPTAFPDLTKSASWFDELALPTWTSVTTAAVQ